MNYKFSNIQIKQIVEIFSNLGILTIGATVIPNIFTETQFVKITVTAGITVSFTLWTIAIYLLQRLKS